MAYTGPKHLFEAFRPGGVVCVYRRTLVAERDGTSVTVEEYCGYPAGHPIHETPEEYDARREAEQPNPVNVLRGIVAGMIPRAEESYDIAMRCLDEIAKQLQRIAATEEWK